MDLRVSILARDRRFSKSMRRILPRLDDFRAALGRIELEYPIHDAILVAITDDKGPDYFEEIPNSDGYFQVFVGCEAKSTDEETIRDLFRAIRRVVRTCPLSTTDAARFAEVIERFGQIIGGEG